MYAAYLHLFLKYEPLTRGLVCELFLTANKLPIVEPSDMYVLRLSLNRHEGLTYKK